jgi:hypothetical protein
MIWPLGGSGQVLRWVVICFFIIIIIIIIIIIFVRLFVCSLIVTFSFTQFVSGFPYFNVTIGALIPRRSTAHREGRRISFV